MNHGLLEIKEKVLSLGLTADEIKFLKVLGQGNDEVLLFTDNIVVRASKALLPPGLLEDKIGPERALNAIAPRLGCQDYNIDLKDTLGKGFDARAEKMTKLTDSGWSFGVYNKMKRIPLIDSDRVVRLMVDKRFINLAQAMCGKKFTPTIYLGDQAAIWAIEQSGVFLIAMAFRMEVGWVIPVL